MFVPTEFNWIGSFNSETGITAMWHTAKVKTFEDAFTETAVLGGSGPNDSETYPFADEQHHRHQVPRRLSGYKSNIDGMLAMERGEVEGVSGSWASLKANCGRIGCATSRSTSSSRSTARSIPTCPTCR